MERKFSYRCGSCNWKFKRTSKPKLCPHCGKANSVEKDALQGAEDLLKELDEIEAQFRK